MSKTFKDLTKEDIELITKLYESDNKKEEVQRILANTFGVLPRAIRDWAKKLNLGVNTIINPAKIMVYDIETSRATFKLFWNNQQFVPAEAMTDEPKIISICWKWLGKDEIHSLCWDENKSDEEMLYEFTREYNISDLVIGQNNDRFDNRWINARCAKYNIDVNTQIRSFDIMKENKAKFRLPSYKLSFMCKYFGVEQKLQHEGKVMWDMIEDGTKEEQKEYLQKMIEYNRGDIVSTEALYYRLRKYYGHKIHIGVLNDEPKWTSPSNGSYNVSLYKTTVTPAGTIQRIMKCNDDGTLYKINNKNYMDYLDFKIKNERIDE